MMGVYFSEAARAIHTGPDCRCRPQISARTMSAWTFPPADTANSAGPTSSATIGPDRPDLASVHVTPAVAMRSTVDQAIATTSRGRNVNGIQTTAYHGEYQ